MGMLCCKSWEDADDYMIVFLEVSVWNLVPRKSRAPYWYMDDGPVIITNVVLILRFPNDIDAYGGKKLR